jgi:protein-disulfide isomerase
MTDDKMATLRRRRIPWLLLTLASIDAAAYALAADDSVVASIGKQAITDQELNARMATKLDQARHDYAVRLNELKRNFDQAVQANREKELGSMVDESVLALEAKARKTTSKALVAAVEVPQITDSETHAFYDGNANQIGQPYDAVAPKIRAYLQKQAADSAQRSYLDSLRKKYDAVITLAPIRESVAATGPQRGPAEAPVTIVEFSDFQCPFCGRLAPVMRAVLAKYPTQVRLVYRHLPLTSLHPNAEKAAEAAVCAQEQGKFWEMHDLMFADQSGLEIDALKGKAKRLQLDIKSFDECLDSGKERDAVMIDTHAAEQLGIGGTPASFINGRFINGVRSLDELSVVIDDELQRAGRVARR